MKAKKNLGQNFLVDKNIINKIISSIPSIEEYNVIEVGPGMGALTKGLSIRSKNLTVIEIDEDMIPYLEKLSNEKGFNIVNKNILDVKIRSLLNQEGKYQMVSNLPYYISTKILFLFIIEKKIDFISIMLQKELIDRMISKHNNKQYGRLTVAVRTFFDIIEKIDVSKFCFLPAPKIDSGFIVLKRKEIDIDIPKYLDFVKKAFSAKRKTMINSFKLSDKELIPKISLYLKSKNIDLNVRSEQIEIEIFVDMFKYLYE